MSIISELNDNCFVITTEFFVDLCKEVEQEAGRKPTLDELCELLTWGLKGINTEILSDVNINSVESIIAKCRKKKRRVSVGDLVAVPADNGQWYLGVYIATNRFGCAYGFFKGTWPLRPIDSNHEPLPLLPIVNSGTNAIIEGKWKIIGNSPSLLKLFPSELEIYHYKKDHPDNASIGPFGSAEKVDGQLREIDENEGKTVGLHSGIYRPTVIEDLVSNYLKQLNELN